MRCISAGTAGCFCECHAPTSELLAGALLDETASLRARIAELEGALRGVIEAWNTNADRLIEGNQLRGIHVDDMVNAARRVLVPAPTPGGERGEP